MWLALVLAACSSSKPFQEAPDASIEGGADAQPTGCASTETSCAGVCVDTQKSAVACGGCGRKCATGEACCSGACTSDPTCGFEITSITPDRGWVSGGAYLTIKGKGFKSGLAIRVGDGRAPARVVDDATITALTPPGLAGTYDVHVAQGALTATLPQAFRYQTEAFEKQWQTISMSSPRGNFPGITTLQDGRVLIAGGMATSFPASSLDSAELFSPNTLMITAAAGPMAVKRNTVSAITLLDGRALLVGACNDPSGTGCLTAGDRQIADLFDPKTNTFSQAKSTMVSNVRFYDRLTMLPDGRVLVTSLGPDSSKAEIFDPATDTFSAAPFTSSAAGGFGFPVRLRDGRVLFFGATSEVFDPDANKLSPIQGAPAHGPATVITLPDGRVMSPAGADLVSNIVTPTADVYVFDPVKTTGMTNADKISSPRWKFGSALLGDGTVMVAAGVMGNYPITYGCQANTFPTTDAVDVIDSQTGKVTAFPPIKDHNMELVATTMLDGSIVIGGGSPCGGAGAYAYVYFLKSVPPPN